MRKLLFWALLAILFTPVWVFSYDRDDIKCIGPTSITCTSPPCILFGANGTDFGGRSNYFWVNINLTGGSSFSADVEGTARGGVFGTVGGPYTTGVNGFLTATPPVIRFVINDCTDCAGQVVICGYK